MRNVMIQRSLQFYEFGPFRLNATERLLHRDGELVALTPKVFDTLLVLVENCGHIVEKNQLMEQLWPDSFVEESSLTQNISLLRKALSEGDVESNYIETIPKRGYRFVEPVNERHELTNGNALFDIADVFEGEQFGAMRASPIPEPARKPSKRYLEMFAVVAVLFGIFGFIYWSRHTPTREVSGVRSIAVLPFKTIGTDAQNDLLGLGMADALIIKLSKLDQLTVLPTSSVFRYTNRDKDAAAIGNDLGVEGVLDGTVQRDGDSVRVTAQLIRLKDGKTLWSGKFDERYSSIFLLQDSISEQLTASLRPQVGPVRETISKAHPTDDMQAYQSYLTGLYFWNRRTHENLPKAIHYLEEAVARDPNFAAARAMLADCYYLSAEGEYLVATPEEALERATTAVSRALEIDDNLAEAHTVKAGIKLVQKQFDEAESEFRRALELNPNYAVAHLRYGYYLFYALKLDEALVHMRRAQQLDPVSPITNGALAGMLYNAHDFDGCIAYAARAVELEPTVFGAHVNLGEAYAHKRMFKEAQAAFDKAGDVNPAYVLWEKAYAFALAGQRAEALRKVAEAEKQNKTGWRMHINYAQLYAALGDKDKAFAEMELMQMGRFMAAPVKYDPAFDLLRDDERFASFLKRHNIQ
jgi:DNA-binding winged helix-turn-helix (wHTH) protein/TolB-like protein/tetratricopeptide (TPR) repeat protein